MEYFAVQVWTGHEDDFSRNLLAVSHFGLDVYVPKRVLVIRKRGKIRREERPLFSGYIFIGADTDRLDLEKRWTIKTTKYFIRILPDNADARPIGQRDRHILAHFMSFGKAADTSKVLFDENDRISVLEGPLKGLEGMIVKVDRRKQRAKVRLDMCQDAFLVDLAFEVIERPAKGSDNTDEPS
ncbi:MAG: antiterminator LoaP [Spirochaetales bacterium]|nr:MAG: antiterminator LoaP [Spirochaetales bacterium]